MHPAFIILRHQPMTTSFATTPPLATSIPSVQLIADGIPRFQIPACPDDPTWEAAAALEASGGVSAEIRAFLDAQLETGDVLLDLAPGANVFHVHANDYSGNTSPPLVRSILYQVNQPIALSQVGGGRITGATNGQLLTIGRFYTLTATPNPGMLFSNWSGTVGGSSNVLHFMMDASAAVSNPS